MHGHELPVMLYGHPTLGHQSPKAGLVVAHRQCGHQIATMEGKADA
jgi:hypothetical protein